MEGVFPVEFARTVESFGDIANQPISFCVNYEMMLLDHENCFNKNLVCQTLIMAHRHVSPPDHFLDQHFDHS
jgi:hypothetical protein